MKFLFYSVLLGFSLSSCGPRRMVSGYYEVPIECITSPSGNEVIMVIFSSGRNRKNALYNARKASLNVVLFGSDKMSASCTFKPLFNDVEKQRNLDYFNRLLDDDAFVLKATSLKNERVANKVFRDISKSRKQIRESFVITLNMDIVKHKLKLDEVK